MYGASVGNSLRGSASEGPGPERAYGTLARIERVTEDRP